MFPSQSQRELWSKPHLIYYLNTDLLSSQIAGPCIPKALDRSVFRMETFCISCLPAMTWWQPWVFRNTKEELREIGYKGNGLYPEQLWGLQESSGLCIPELWGCACAWLLSVVPCTHWSWRVSFPFPSRLQDGIRKIHIYVWKGAVVWICAKLGFQATGMSFSDSNHKYSLSSCKYINCEKISHLGKLD